MMRGRLLFVLWCSNVLAAARSITDSCVSDYMGNITCAWNITEGRPVCSNNCSMTFNETSGSDSTVSCPLVTTDWGFLCTCKVASLFSSVDVYDIQLCNESACQMFQKGFKPADNIKLTPPPEVELQQSTDTINITCQSKRYQKHFYLRDELHYEVVLQESHSSWSRTSEANSQNNIITHNKSHLRPNKEYCIKARFKPPDKYRGSTWSEWSEPKCFINEQKEEQEDIVPILLKSLSPVCVTVGILLFVFYNPAARMKIKTLAHTPTPAPFFKPLFQQHEGNLQEWISPHGKPVLTYKSEENLITHSVTVMPKSSPKDLEENQDFPSAPPMQLLFLLSPTSYVGLPGTDKASSPIHAVSPACPGDTPYTQLPCPIWGFGVQEVEVVCSDPKEFLEMSHSDSGCEDLTQSPECSLPCSPVEEFPPPIHCTDYCILNKTAAGVVPVLLSKERCGDAPSVPWKSEG